MLRTGSVSLDGDPQADQDEDSAGDSLDRRAYGRLPERMADAIEQVGVKGQPHHSLEGMDRCEGKRANEDAIGGRHELGDEGQIKEGNLRIQNVGEESLKECRTLGDTDLCGCRPLRLPGVPNRLDTEE